MKRTVIACAIAMAFVAPGVWAEAVPASGSLDARIKSVDYNPQDVVKVVGHFGYSTDIQFSEGESVKSVALGDSLAWAVAPVENHIFVKPREPHATTNMTVITNKHVYQFALIGDPSRSEPRKDFYYQVRFEYPLAKAARTAVADNTAAVQAALMVNDKPRNWNYYGCGPYTVRPTQVYDDGRFTYFTFPAAQQVPAIYYINGDGSESITNGQMRGDQFVVFGTAAKFVLRRGNEVGCIENRSYNPYGVYTPTGTTSPGVRRVLKTTAPATPVPTETVPPVPKEKQQPSLMMLPDLGFPPAGSSSAPAGRRATQPKPSGS